VAERSDTLSIALTGRQAEASRPSSAEEAGPFDTNSELQVCCLVKPAQQSRRSIAVASDSRAESSLRAQVLALWVVGKRHRTRQSRPSQSDTYLVGPQGEFGGLAISAKLGEHGNQSKARS